MKLNVTMKNMNKIQPNKIRNFLTLMVITLTLFTGIQSKNASANQAFSFSPYIDLTNQGLPGKSWLPPLSNPSQSDELLFADDSGKLYRATGQKIEAEPIFDFVSHLKEYSPIRFTAIALHPNFHLLDQEGSKTIYTAHIEAFNKESTNDRLQSATEDVTYSHDAVVLEWQINNTKVNDITLTQVREVMRIATTSDAIDINHLAFNPLLKSWDEDFGLIFIALDADPAFETEPLYSGAILRINPQKFGSINYSIPPNNPFIATQEVNDEIVVLGAKKISNLLWTKYTKSNVILTHEYDDKTLMSMVALGNDLIKVPPVNNIYQSENSVISLSNQYYSGRDLTHVRNKFLILSNQADNWILESIALNQPLSPKTEVTLSNSDFSTMSKLSLHTPRENEVLLLDQSNSVIYKLTASLVKTKAPLELIPSTESVKDITLDTQDKETIYKIAIGAAIAVILLILYFIKRKYQRLFSKTKTLLRSNYARFRFDEETNKVSFYKRHQSGVDKVIPIEDIYSSEVFLNEKSIGSVTSTKGQNFNNERDKEMRRVFEEEHRHKMVDRKVRKINIKLFTNKGEEVLVCAYLREGNQRFTRETFHVVIEYVLDWQWYLSIQLHEDETPERAPKLISQKPRNRPIKAQVKSTQPPVNQQANVDTSQVAPDVAPAITPEHEVNEDLVDSLSTLVTLKEKGYLSEEEFIAAKSRILIPNNDTPTNK